MIIELNSSKIKALENVIKTHDFKTFLGFTSKFRGFEIPNLDNEVKMSVLRRLSTENWRDVPCFTSFWAWFRKKHGMQLATQICKHMFPENEKTCQSMINCMRNSTSHDWWNHIKARVYKKWCSILTEMQAVYAVVSGSKKLGLDWRVIASAPLDAMGVDFIIITKDSAIPVQIKKDSFHQQISHKQNNKENLSRFDITKKAMKLINEEIIKNKFQITVSESLLLKYALPNKDTPAYDYLGHFPNNFVYFDHKKLVEKLHEVLVLNKNAANDEYVKLAI